MLTSNKKAYFDYRILDSIEAGLKLSGPEVKSAKTGQANLKGAYIDVPSEHEACLVNAYISPYKPAALHQKDYNPYRRRQLLLHKKQIRRLIGKSKESGIAIIPLKLYLNHGLVKLEIGLAQGKKKYDKRESLKQRDFARRKRQLMN